MKFTFNAKEELDRILEFIRKSADGEKVVVPVSGGLDSDVVARLCAMAIGTDRLRIFIVRQNGLEEKYVANALNLAEDIGVELSMISLGNMNIRLIQALHEAAPNENFQPDSLLDPARAYCSLRTAIISTYQDKGYLVSGNSNRTEAELGFFLPFGDNLGHFKPIVHLYKTEVKMLAKLIKCRDEVISQQPSAGFWKDENDLEDIAFWIYNKGPVQGGRVFSDEECEKVYQIVPFLSHEKIDGCLMGINAGMTDTQISKDIELPEDIVQAIRTIKCKASLTKNRPLLTSLERM